MALVPMSVILEAAEIGGFGVGAYNVNNMEQIQGIMAAAAETQSPVILQVSRGALHYANNFYLVALINTAAQLHPKIPIAMHLDHGNSPETCIKAINLGFTSVMMDGSLGEDGKTHTKYDYNARVTREVVDYAHKRGVTVEGEIGCLGGIEDGHGSGMEVVTNPADAKRLIQDTKIDALAVAWGTSHGAYKFKKGAVPVLRHDVVKQIHQENPGVYVYLVSHGSSSVPESLTTALNSYGVFNKYTNAEGHQMFSAYGQEFDLTSANPVEVLSFLVDSMRMPATKGVPLSDLSIAIRNGMRKINVDTDGRIAVTGAILDVLHSQPSEFDPRKYLGPARDAITAFVKERMEAFGTAGHAGDVEIVSLEEMARRY